MSLGLRCEDSDFYSGVCRLDSWPGHRLFWQRSFCDSSRYIPR